MRLQTNYEVAHTGRIVQETKAKARLIIEQANDGLEFLMRLECLVREFDGKMYNVKFDNAFREYVKDMVQGNSHTNAYITKKTRYVPVDPNYICACMNVNIRKWVEIPDGIYHNKISVSGFYINEIFVHNREKRINIQEVLPQIEKEREHMKAYLEQNAPVVLMSDEELLAILEGLNERTKEYNAYIDGLPSVMREAINN